MSVGAVIPPAVRALLLAGAATLGLGMTLLVWKTTAIGSMLFMNHGMSHERTVLVELVLGWALIGLVVTLAWSPARGWAAAGLLAVAAFLAWANVDQGGYPFSRFAWGAHALRLAAPLALLLAVLPWSPLAVVRRQVVTALLLTTTALVFIVHGVEALAAHPWFTDMTIGAFRMIGGWRISQATAESILKVVGSVDLLVAVGVLVFRRPCVARWMAGWGLFTAALRPLNYGWGAMGELIVRLPHFLLPLALLLLFRVRAFSPPSPTPQSP